MTWSRWPWTNRMYVCICLYFCVFEFLGVIRVRCSVRPWSDPHFLSQYTIMVMVGVRLSWLNPNDILDSGRTDCTFVFLWLAFDRVIGVRSRKGRNSTFFPPVKTHLNGDDFRAFILVKPMAQSRWPWTNRRYVCIPVCLTLVLLLGFHLVWGHDLSLLITFQNILQWRWSACVYFCWIDVTISLDLDEQGVSSYFCVLGSDHVIGVWSSAITCSFPCQHVRLYACVLDFARVIAEWLWGQNLTIMPFHNTLRWQ